MALSVFFGEECRQVYPGSCLTEWAVCFIFRRALTLVNIAQICVPAPSPTLTVCGQHPKSLFRSSAPNNRNSRALNSPLHRTPGVYPPHLLKVYMPPYFLHRISHSLTVTTPLWSTTPLSRKYVHGAENSPNYNVPATLAQPSIPFSHQVTLAAAIWSPNPRQITFAKFLLKEEDIESAIYLSQPFGCTNPCPQGESVTV